MSIKTDNYKNIIILTGAGISVASGLGTYRGANSVTTDNEIQYSGHAERLHDNPSKLWEFYGPLREKIQTVEPNAAHRFLAKLEQSLNANQNFCLITQNVDGLHQKAGSKNVVELHGNLGRSRCSNTDCATAPFIDNKFHHGLPCCRDCGAILRPDIVLFGEQLSVDTEWKTKKSMRGCDLFVAIGTSGSVSPASNLVRSADFEGARTVLLNLEPMEVKNPYFQEEYLGEAESLVAEVFDFTKK